ncbi:MAG: hypothetical protein GWO40_12500 [Gammaproteobacteria bacterium]|nr:hypothetical protein [Gammaproteobacteria bacterium]NIV51933.1 hypothetical protein [Gammaproteobacteria bacterium]NIX86363.1 hypothetical protein [Gammaproteobacteria bacterium]
MIATLFYLALQVRESAEQFRAGRAQDISGTLQEGFLPIYYPGNLTIWHKGHLRPGELEEDEKRTFDLFMDRQCYTLQNIVYQHQRGLIEDDVYQSTLDVMRDIVMSSPGGAAYWAERRHLFTPALRAALGDTSD